MKFAKAIVNSFFVKKKNESECHAPYSSMRFNHSGNVLVCCFNRGNVLGRFPEQSIEEIWFGDTLKQLQNAIDKKDFSLGCQSCEKYISCNNREASGAYQYDYLRNYNPHKSYPTMFDFELGSTCNFECIMCSGEYSTAIRANREKKSPYYSPYEAHPDIFVNQLTPFIPHLKEMRFIGGEPFLMKIYYGIWDKVIEMNPDILLNVLTNGSILNKRVRTILEKGNFKIAVSIDSLVKETYEAIRINGDFDQVMENIAFFHKLTLERGHTMNFNLCVMRQNWQEIPDYFRYCNEHGIQVVLHTVEFPNHCSLWNLTTAELHKIESLYRETILSEGKEIEKTNKQTFEALTRQIESWYHRALTREAEGKSLLSPKEQLRNKLELVVDSNYRKDFDYFNFISEAAQTFTEQERNMICSYLLTIDIHLVIHEINVSSQERMFERFKIIVQNHSHEQS